jgi:hypothetical protein
LAWHGSALIDKMQSLNVRSHRISGPVNMTLGRPCVSATGE